MSKQIGSICNCGQCPFMSVQPKIEPAKVPPFLYELVCRRMLISRGELKHIATIPVVSDDPEWDIEAFAMPDWCPLEDYDGPYQQRG